MKLSWNVCMITNKLKMHTTGVPTLKKKSSAKPLNDLMIVF